MRKNLLTFFVVVSALLLPELPATALDAPDTRHEVRLGWGDMLFESAVWHNTSSNFNYRYIGHFFADYRYNINDWLSVGGQIDWENVLWDTRYSIRHGFFNLSLMPSARFTYYRKGVVSMFGGVSAGLLMNGGTELDFKGRKTVFSPVFGLTLYGISINLSRHISVSAELGGLNALVNKHQIHMIGSRLLSLSIGYRF